MPLFLKTTLGIYVSVALVERDCCQLRYEVRVYRRGFPGSYSVAVATSDILRAERVFDLRSTEVI